MEEASLEVEYTLPFAFNEKYTILEKLGTGGFGAAYKISTKKNDATLVAKISKLDSVFRNEESMLKRLTGHENIVRFEETFRTSTFGFMIIEGARNGITPLVYCGKSIARILSENKMNGAITANNRLNWCRQMCNGITFIHSRMIGHRDLKTENIALTGQIIKILDFGLAIDLNGYCDEAVGTVTHQSPEAIQGLQYKADKNDVFAFGMVMYEIFAGSLPFVSNDYTSETLPEVNWTGIQNNLKSILINCWKFDFKRRPTAYELIWELLTIENAPKPAQSSSSTMIPEPSREMRNAVQDLNDNRDPNAANLTSVPDAQSTIVLHVSHVSPDANAQNSFSGSQLNAQQNRNKVQGLNVNRIGRNGVSTGIQCTKELEENHAVANFPNSDVHTVVPVSANFPNYDVQNIAPISTPNVSTINEPVPERSTSRETQKTQESSVVSSDTTPNGNPACSDGGRSINTISSNNSTIMQRIMPTRVQPARAVKRIVTSKAVARKNGRKPKTVGRVQSGGLKPLRRYLADLKVPLKRNHLPKLTTEQKAEVKRLIRENVGDVNSLRDSDIDEYLLKAIDVNVITRLYGKSSKRRKNC